MSTAGNFRLRDTLLLRVLLPMAAMLLISGGVGYGLSLSFVSVSYDRALLESARALALQVHVTGKEVLLDMPAAAEEILRADTSDHIYYQVFVVSQREVAAGDTVLPNPPDEVVDEPKFYDAMVQGEAVRGVRIALVQTLDDKQVIVQFAETRYKRQVLARDLALALVLPQIVLMLLAWWAIRRGVLVGLRPLDQLVALIARRRPDEKPPLPSREVPQELLPLLSAFNALLDRLHEGSNMQRRFIADAAHQLRTPLAALSIQLERALREPDAALRELLLHQLVGSIERTARLSSQLLLLVRAEPGGIRQNHENVDICALAFQTGSEWVYRALEKGVDLGLDTPKDALFVKAEPVMLGELINNLLDNALRYGGKNVTLRVAQTPGGVELSVEDDGPGLPKGEERKVFGRFYRPPGTSGDGSGLGLAIVREIADGFGAAAGYRKSRAGGACFYVRFAPAQQENS